MFPYYLCSTSKVENPAALVGKRTCHFQKAPVTGGAWVDGQGHRGSERLMLSLPGAEKLPLGGTEGGDRTKWVCEP